MKITKFDMSKLQAIGRASPKKDLFAALIKEAKTDGMALFNYPETMKNDNQKQSNYRSALKSFINKGGENFNTDYQFAMYEGKPVLVHNETLKAETAKAKA